ncbi:hypothetical protein KCU62_g7439, partial [Aureobasidium sp. EXF-3399]
MSSTEPPPSYYGTTLSEKPVTVSEKPTKAATYHITLQRCKKLILLESGRYGVQGLIEDMDLAITISPDKDWYEVRKKIFDLYKKAWPEHMRRANSADYGLSMSAQYSIRDGEVLGHIKLLDKVGDGLWDFLKRDDVHIINLIASAAPRYKEARGEIRRHPRKSLVDGLELAAVNQAREVEVKSKSKHRCILQ